MDKSIIIISIILVNTDVSEGVYDYVDPDLLQQAQKWVPTMNDPRSEVEEASWMNEWIIRKLMKESAEVRYLDPTVRANQWMYWITINDEREYPKHVSPELDHIITCHINFWLKYSQLRYIDHIITFLLKILLTAWSYYDFFIEIFYDILITGEAAIAWATAEAAQQRYFVRRLCWKLCSKFVETLLKNLLKPLKETF